MAAESHLILDDVSVSFPIYHGASRSLKKSLLSRGTGGRIGSDANQRIVVEALRNVSLSLPAGDRLALVGGNGAGKTTLLRTMARIYEPVSGSVTCEGHVSPMFDIALGIDGEISGYDNIRLRGLIIGMSSKEIEERMEEIAEFTELGDFLDIPVRTYSTGMLTRLSFAVATCFAPEILLMDEWILAGDAAFMTKAQHRINSFLSQANIVVLATHNAETLRKWCTTAVWLDKGEVRASGKVDEILAAYSAAA